MKHDYNVTGFSYELQPVQIDDAEIILKIRLEDAERNKYVHPIKNDVELEKIWLQNYFERSGDYFFKVRNIITKEVEGLIAVYDENNGKAEWGRWTIVKGSLASVESVYLLYEFAFKTLGLKELYCRTIEDNSSVVEFHNSTGLLFRERRDNEFELNGKKFACIEHYITNNLYSESIQENLRDKCFSLFLRNLRIHSGGIEFHHLGIACKNIQKDKKNFQLLGYKFEPDCFEDYEQGVRGIFATSKNQPQIELLENLPDMHTLDPYIDSGIKIYHFGYYVNDIEKCIDFFRKLRAKIVSPLKQSVYFKKRICFIMLNNMILIELMERN